MTCLGLRLDLWSKEVVQRKGASGSENVIFGPLHAKVAGRYVKLLRSDVGFSVVMLLYRLHSFSARAAIAADLRATNWSLGSGASPATCAAEGRGVSWGCVMGLAVTGQPISDRRSRGL